MLLSLEASLERASWPQVRTRVGFREPPRKVPQEAGKELSALEYRRCLLQGAGR